MRLVFFHDMLQILLDRRREVSENFTNSTYRTSHLDAMTALPLHTIVSWTRNSRIDVLLCMYIGKYTKMNRE
jgi:hypothetical protein